MLWIHPISLRRISLPFKRLVFLGCSWSEQYTMSSAFIAYFHTQGYLSCSAMLAHSHNACLRNRPLILSMRKPGSRIGEICMSQGNAKLGRRDTIAAFLVFTALSPSLAANGVNDCATAWKCTSCVTCERATCKAHVLIHEAAQTNWCKMQIFGLTGTGRKAH